MTDVKKPSEIVATVEQRDTARPTDLNDLEMQAARSVSLKGRSTICCCIDPYIEETAPAYVPGDFLKEGDVHKHTAVVLNMVVFFNICYRYERVTDVSIRRAADGVPLKTVTADDLSNPNSYYLVRQEKCHYGHHDFRRLSYWGRLLKYLCTCDGLASTCSKVCGCEEYKNVVPVRTIRCERSLYSQRKF
jgi:hypothetical protein